MAESGASALLPRWMSCAAKLFSLKEVPFTTGASTSNGLTDASEARVMYCRASHRAVLPSWSFSSRSSLSTGRHFQRYWETGTPYRVHHGQNRAYCLHCSSWLKTGSFPEATASCSGVLHVTKISVSAAVASARRQWPASLPALAVLHVSVGSGLEQRLRYPSHSTHHLCRVLLGAERADQVERGFYCSHGGGVHLSRVADEEDGCKFIP